MFYRRKLFTGKIWGEGGRVCDFLLIGWWGGNGAVLSLQLLSSTGVGALVPTEGVKDIVMYFP